MSDTTRKLAIAVLATAAVIGLFYIVGCVTPVDAKNFDRCGKKNPPWWCTTTTTTQPVTTTTAAPTTTTTVPTTTTAPTTTTSTTSTTAPPTTTTTTTTVPTGSDETPAVLAQLEANGSIYINREYRIDSPLVPPAGSTITFGPGGKFVRTDALGYGIRKWPVLDLRHGNITVINPVIEGPNTGRYTYTRDGQTYLYAHEGTGIGGVDPNMEESGGIVFNGGSNYEIRNPHISSVWGDGITINGPSTNIVITNPQIGFVGRSIISNLDSDNVRIEGGAGFGAFWWGINMETIGTRGINDFTVSNFGLGWNRFQQIFADGTYFNCNVSNVDLTGVYFTSFWTGTRIDPCVANEIALP